MGWERANYLMGLLDKKGCDIPKFNCECCDGDTEGHKYDGYYTSKNTITICYNRVIDHNLFYSQIVEHELFHAVQRCYEEKEDNKCKTSICKEIEAYNNSHCARYADPIEKRRCVEDGVMRSSAGACKKWFGLGKPDKTRMKKYIEELYDKCKTRER